MFHPSWTWSIEINALYFSRMLILDWWEALVAFKTAWKCTSYSNTFLLPLILLLRHLGVEAKRLQQFSGGSFAGPNVVYSDEVGDSGFIRIAEGSSIGCPWTNGNLFWPPSWECWLYQSPDDWRGGSRLSGEMRGIAPCGSSGWLKYSRTSSISRWVYMWCTHLITRLYAGIIQKVTGFTKVNNSFFSQNNWRRFRWIINEPQKK
jgi:hypothetical protein